MEVPHSAEPPPAACLRAPLQPHSRAPAARSQRGPQHSAQGELGTEPGPGSEQPLAPGTDCDTQTAFSELGTSNQEYYLKLEELRNAHLETMAKLESMYRNKLYLQGAQRLERNNANSAISYVCCRPTWEKSTYQPLSLPRSFSDSSISDPFGSGVSGESNRELPSEDSCSETGSSLFAKERIARMWDGFSVDDYLPPRKHSLPRAPAARTTRKQKAWSPKVTVPKPFQMTIREARRKEQNVKSKSQIEMENNLLKKQLEEEAECQKKFRATPVPAAVFLPLYREIVQRNEERRKSVKERSKLRLLASQKPFKFIEREKQRDEIRKMQLRDLSTPERKTKPFKAKPVPRCVYSPSVRDKLQEEELYREIRIRMRAEELLRNASLPSSRLASKDANKKEHKCAEPKETERQPKVQHSVPDFDRLHQKFQKRLRRQQQVKHLTVCEPFHLRTPSIPSNKGKVLRDIQEDEERLKETRWPYASPRRKPKTRQSSANSPLLGSGESRSPKVTQSSQRRLQALRNSHEEKRRLEEQQKRNRTKQKQRTKKLQRIVTTRAEANDPHQSLAQVSKSKLKAFRNSAKQRTQEYLQELQEMEERVNQRPLLLERVTQNNARIAAEKYYSNRLRALGVSPDLVSKKGQTTKLLKCCSAEDFGAKERVSKDQVKGREFFEEAASISPQSEQSFEEEKRKGIRTPSWDGESAESEKEEETQASPQVQQPHCAEEARSSPTSDQYCEEEEQKEEKEEEEEAKAGLLLGHSLEEENEEEEDGSRPSSQSDQSQGQQEEGQSDSEDEGAFQYEDEEYESDDSDEKPSDDEAD
ncbi:protein FAM161A [Excalfactoria chinensis]|uniref:protein FAM161A n=1 Tax=Excalfactoria chinensis TaxID=46218 RepID=UPI003B39FECD